MKRICFLIFLLLLMVLFGVKSTIAQKQNLENLLLNPSFEEGENHFVYWNRGGTATYIFTEPWHAYHGDWSFGIGNNLEWTSEDSWGSAFQVLLDPEDPQNLYLVIPGDKFTFEMWMMIEENYNGKSSLKIDFFAYDRRLGLKGEPLASFQSKIHTGVIIKRWFKETVEGTAPEGTVSVVVSCLSEDMGEGSKYVFFDAGVVTITRTGSLL